MAVSTSDPSLLVLFNYCAATGGERFVELKRLLGVRVEARKLEHHYPHALKSEVIKCIPAVIILNPCSNFLGVTIGFRASGL